MFKPITAAIVAICLWAPPIHAAETDHAALREDSLQVLEAQFGAFRTAAGQLSEASQAHCAGEKDDASYEEAFRATWLAWAPLDAYQFGPVEQNAAVLTVAFWPDKKDFVGRGLKSLLAHPEDSLSMPETIAAQSAAVQGLPAIERLVFTEMAACPAIVGISANIEYTAIALYDGWFAEYGFADLARSAGPENPFFATDAEFTKLLYTAIDFELTRIADTRLGRPLNTYDKPMPRRAEAWRSGLSLQIIDAQLAGIQLLLRDGFGNNLFSPSKSWVDGAIDDTRARIDVIGAPLDQAVADPLQRARVEALQTRILYLQQQFAEDVGPELGVDTGFSAADGD
ncbi:imelysin family protein [Aliiruegeria sabulilitoris]|uniref:imelysin family protein n=1 Tax=Aliiruegeria sabulilitoris TaxID=1510458 RepID=UPI00083668FE|nr:imelysin family protein [Aliiruegeria sabulilitoris]